MWISHTVTWFVQELLDVMYLSVQNLLSSPCQTAFFLFACSWLWLISFITYSNFLIKLSNFAPHIVSLNWLQFFWHLSNVNTQYWPSVTLDVATVSSPSACTSQRTMSQLWISIIKRGHKGIKVSMESVLFLLDFNTRTKKFQISVIIPNMRYHVDPTCRSLCSTRAGRWTNRYPEANVSFPQLFCEHI